MESDNSDTSSDGSSHLNELALGAVMGAYAWLRYIQNPVLNNQTGRQWVELILLDRDRCKDNFRMYPEYFLFILVRDYGLQSTQEVESKEGLAMFLWTCGTQQCFRQVREWFQRSMETINRKMGEVLESMLAFAHTMIGPKDPSYANVHHSFTDYYPFFDGCIGAIDGTHIRVQLPKEDRENFMNRHGFTSYNVLGAVDMDMRFTYVGTGMSGACHDMRVLRECMNDPNFPKPPPGKYYLVDSGYANQKGYLAPYRRTISVPKELHFNSHHASLRNVHAFGVLKNRWRILRDIPCYGRDRQRKIIIACCALHNFLLDIALANEAETNNTGETH
ncbi:LOW QUALITY PROTEIN: hypothetical protein U9M48_037302, partial [Paspalum notatum var. saurae]